MKTDLHTLVLGLQFDSEGGTDIIKALYPTNDVYVRFNGSISHDATPLETDNFDQIHLHVYDSHAIHVITQGVFLDIEVLADQMKKIEKESAPLTADKFFLSHLSQLIMPWHRKHEELLANETKREYFSTFFALSDKIVQHNFRLIDLFSPTFKERFLLEGTQQNKFFRDLGEQEIDLEKSFIKLMKAFLHIQGFVTDTYSILEECRKEKKNFLFETPLGLMQDMNTGPSLAVSPFPCTPQAIVSGTGMVVTSRNIGVFSPFLTQVSSKPEVIEFAPQNKNLIRNNHNLMKGVKKLDSISWLDIPMLKYALQFDIHELALIQLNCLSNIDEIHVCSRYIDLYNDQERFYTPSFDFERESITKIYESFPSWHEDLTGKKHFKDFPLQAKEFIYAIEQYIDRKITYIVLGANKEDIVIR